MRTLRADPDVDSEEGLVRYMFRAIATSGLKLGRKRGNRRRALVAFAGEDNDEDANPLKRFLKHEEKREIRRLYRKAMELIPELPVDQRQAFELVVVRDPPLTLREVAEIQGVAISTVHLRLAKAVDALREALEEAEVDES